MLASTAYGAKNYRLMGYWLILTMVVVTLACLPVGASWFFAGDIMRAFIGEETMTPELQKLTNQFGALSTIGLLPLQWYTCLNNFLVSQKIVLPQLFVGLLVLASNVGFNFLFIYGLPAAGWGGLGFAGSPLATAASRWLSCLLAFTYVYCSGLHRLAFPPSDNSATANDGSDGSAASVCRESFRCRRIVEFLKQSWPLALTGLLEDGQLQLVAIFAGHLGKTAIATHNAIFQVFWFLTSMMWGVSASARTRCAHYLGAGDVAGAKRVLKVALGVGGATAAVVAAVFCLGRNSIGHLYSNDAAVLQLTSEVAILVGSAYALLVFFYVVMAALVAQGRSGFVAVAFVIGAWGFSVPLAYVFAFEVKAVKGLLGLWLGMAVGYAVVTLIAGIALVRGDWEKVAAEAMQRGEAKAAGGGREATAGAEAGGAAADGLMAAEEAQQQSGINASGNELRVPLIDDDMVGGAA